MIHRATVWEDGGPPPGLYGTDVPWEPNRRRAQCSDAACGPDREADLKSPDPRRGSGQERRRVQGPSREWRSWQESPGRPEGTHLCRRTPSLWGLATGPEAHFADKRRPELTRRQSSKWSVCDPRGIPSEEARRLGSADNEGLALGPTLERGGVQGGARRRRP